MAVERYPEVAREIIRVKEAAAERQAEGQKSGGRGKKKTWGSREPQVSKSADQLGAAVGVSGASWKRTKRLVRVVYLAQWYKARGQVSLLG